MAKLTFQFNDDSELSFREIDEEEGDEGDYRDSFMEILTSDGESFFLKLSAIRQIHSFLGSFMKSRDKKEA